MLSTDAVIHRRNINYKQEKPLVSLSVSCCTAERQHGLDLKRFKHPPNQATIEMSEKGTAKLSTVGSQRIKTEALKQQSKQAREFVERRSSCHLPIEV